MAGPLWFSTPGFFLSAENRLKVQYFKDLQGFFESLVSFNLTCFDSLALGTYKMDVAKQMKKRLIQVCVCVFLVMNLNRLM